MDQKDEIIKVKTKTKFKEDLRKRVNENVDDIARTLRP